ncbi:phenylalanyl-tRNA synthetase, beta subunit, partial [Streptococcus agalactiae COH1]
MHAFDFDKFDGTTIVARNAENGEKLITLDGEERDLIADDLVIAVNDQPVALAGVMGGQS